MQIGRLEGGASGLSRRIVEDLRFSRPGEEIIWIDRFGTLLISRIEVGAGSGYSLRLGDQVRVDVINGEPAIIESAPDITEETIEHFFNDQVLPRVLSVNGTFVLHAAAIDIGGSAILLQGDSGRGKSTLSASFHQQGYKLMGDDAIILSAIADVLSATAVYPSLRLLPDSLRSVFPDNHTSRQVSQNSDKKNVDFTVSGFDYGQAVPIATAFILSGETADQPELQKLGNADACMELVKNSFALNPIDPEIARKKLMFASAVAEEIPFYSFSYPRDFARLSEVTSALLDVI